MKNRTLLFSVGLKDVRVDTFRVSGHGGQKVNKTESGVRLTHAPSGAVAQSTDFREQRKNKVEAMRRLATTPKFKAWVALRAGHSEKIYADVERMMRPENIKVEYGDEIA